MCTTAVQQGKYVVETTTQIIRVGPKVKVAVPVVNKCFRKVTFALRPMIIIIEDDEDRKGPWEILAVDRDRFNRRILNVESQIGWCFGEKHRENIFNQRINTH